MIKPTKMDLMVDDHWHNALRLLLQVFTESLSIKASKRDKLRITSTHAENLFQAIAILTRSTTNSPVAYLWNYLGLLLEYNQMWRSYSLEQYYKLEILMWKKSYKCQRVTFKNMKFYTKRMDTIGFTSDIDDTNMSEHVETKKKKKA